MILNYGALVAETLEKQAEKQGYKLEKAEILDKLNKSITMLYLHGILTESETKKARGRLHKKVISNLQVDK